MVIFDSELIKAENTGIHFFIKNLASALIRKSAEENLKIKFYLRKRCMEDFSKAVDDNPDFMAYRSLNKYVFPYWKTFNSLWHTSFQYPRIMPHGTGISNLKVLMTIHDLNFLYETDGGDPTRLRRKTQRNIYKATELTTISEYAKNDILNHMDIKDKKVHVIYNGCPEYHGEVCAPANVPDSPFIYAIGPTIAKKNFHTLPCLLKGNDLQLIISGVISSDYPWKIIEQAKKWGVKDRIHFTGPVPEEEKHWYLKNCTAFAFPSLAEGFGIPPIEAMRYGKPVFLSRRTSLPEIGGDKAFYFNNDFDSEGMRAEFEKGMNMFNSGAVDVNAIINHAKSFSWDKAAEQYIKLYKSLLAL